MCCKQQGGNYVPASYHDFIGFQVDTAVLAKAFQKTYGLALDDVFKHRFTLAVETFRWVVKDLFPFITKTAWATKQAQIQKQNPAATEKSFRYQMSKKVYEKEFGKGYKHPGISATLASLIMHLIPKIGPLKALHFKVPNQQAENYFMESFTTVVLHYNAAVKALQNSKESFADVDFDTGKPTTKGEYPLADKTYEQLVLDLKQNNYQYLTKPLQENILHFYNYQVPAFKIKEAKKKKKFLAAFHSLKNVSLRNS